MGGPGLAVFLNEEEKHPLSVLVLWVILYFVFDIFLGVFLWFEDICHSRLFICSLSFFLRYACPCFSYF